MKTQHIITNKSASYLIMFIIAFLGILALFSKNYFEYSYFDEGLWTGGPSQETRLGSYRNLGRSVVPVIFAALFLLLPPIITLINQRIKKRSWHVASAVCATTGLVYIIASSIYFSENYDFYGHATYNGNYYYLFDNFKSMFYIEILFHITMVVISVFNVVRVPVCERSYVKQAYKEPNNDLSSRTLSENNVDELKKLKELLAAGIITQEDFDAKKNQILGL